MHMKNIILLFFCLFSFSALSQVTADVISAEFPVEDQAGRPSLCLTIVRTTAGQLLGIVEPIEDCFYARKARRASQNRLTIYPNDLTPVREGELRRHLQSIDTQLEFYYSGE
jgi:hypothetical protein